MASRYIGYTASGARAFTGAKDDADAMRRGQEYTDKMGSIVTVMKVTKGGYSGNYEKLIGKTVSDKKPWTPNTSHKNPLNDDFDSFLTGIGYTYMSTQDPQPYGGPRTKYDVYKNDPKPGVAVEKSGKWHTYSSGGRMGMTGNGKGLASLKQKLGHSNPGNGGDAVELSKKWHGRDVDSDLLVEELETFEDTVAELADLEELGVLASDLKTESNILFKHDRPKLTSTGDEQLEIIGGDQELEKLNGGKRTKAIGWLVRIVYETDKHHLEGSNGYPESYEHYFAEEFYKEHLDPDDYDTTDEWWEELKEQGVVKLAIKQNIIPMLVYDSMDHKLAIVGGVYSVEDVGIKN